MALQLAVLASGNGSNVQSMLDHVAQGTLDADIRLIVCNRPGAGVLERAARANVPWVCLDHKNWPDREAFDRALITAIKDAGADTVALAGFMRMLTPTFIQAFPQRILNIHPALLPSFPGVHGAEDAQNWGVTITGCTVHFVDEIMDHGAVIVQAAVPALSESVDALKARIQAMEHRIYPQALQWLAQGRLQIEGRSVRLLPAPTLSALAASAPSATPFLVWPPLEPGFY